MKKTGTPKCPKCGHPMLLFLVVIECGVECKRYFVFKCPYCGELKRIHWFPITIREIIEFMGLSRDV